MFNTRNIKFDVRNNRIMYNALTTFRNSYARLYTVDSFKIPSYVLREVFMHKMSLDLFCNNRYIRTYSYDNLKSYLFRREESRIYTGYFRNKQVEYKLTKVEIRKYITYSKQAGGNRAGQIPGQGNRAQASPLS